MSKRSFTSRLPKKECTREDTWLPEELWLDIQKTVAMIKWIPRIFRYYQSWTTKRFIRKWNMINERTHMRPQDSTALSVYYRVKWNTPNRDIRLVKRIASYGYSIDDLVVETFGCYDLCFSCL